jgi:hypothetical protein
MEKLPMDALVTNIEARVNAIDWHAVQEELDDFGCATVERLLTPAECDALKALYVRDELYRSRVVMARHGFGRGEYKYYAYPLPEVIGTLREAVYPHLVPIANRWNEIMRIDTGPRRVYRSMPRCRPASPHTADPAIRAGRLQLPASGLVRRARVSASACVSAVGTRARFHWRGICDDRAAAAHAVAGRSRTASARRRRDFRCS